MTDRERIGAAIAALRAKKQMTVRDLADKTGINHSNLCKIEGGKLAPTIDTLSKIADALGVRIEIIEKPSKNTMHPESFLSNF